MKGANELVVRLGALDPGDFDARLTAARVMAEMGKGVDAAARFRQIADELRERGREEEATNALREAVRLNPEDVEAGRCSRATVSPGTTSTAHGSFSTQTAPATDPETDGCAAEVELRGERDDNARDILKRLLEKDKSKSDAIANLGWTFVNEGR